jgi:hypothetical protein
MQTFQPVPVPFDAPEWFKAWAAQHNDAIRKAAATENNYSAHKVLHAEPSRIIPTMEVYADGADWNPGSGEGKYRRNAANSAWVFIG